MSCVGLETRSWQRFKIYFKSRGNKVRLCLSPDALTKNANLDLSMMPDALLGIERLSSDSTNSHSEGYPWTEDSWNAFVQGLNISDELKLDMIKPKHFH